MPNKYELQLQILKQHPSLIGVIPPVLRFDAIKYLNVPDLRAYRARYRLDRAYQLIEEFQDHFAYEGKYHVPIHFLDVEARLLDDIENLRIIGIKFSLEKIALAKIFSRTHDIVHNAGKEIPYFLTVKKIANLYGFDSNCNKVLQEIMCAINFGIEQDNIYSLAEHNSDSNSDSKFEPRELIDTYHDHIKLSDEEMSGIVADSILYKCGFSDKERRILSGLIQATEFRRSFTVVGKPGIKFPRTQFELLAKLADIGSFYGSTEKWLKLSLDLIQETFAGKKMSPLDFVDFELEFFNSFVKLVLKDENLPIVRSSNGLLQKAIVPQTFVREVRVKLEYLEDLRQELVKLPEDITTGIIDLTKETLSNIRAIASDKLNGFLDLVLPALNVTNCDTTSTVTDTSSSVIIIE